MPRLAATIVAIALVSDAFAAQPSRGAADACRDPLAAAGLERSNANLLLDFVEQDGGTRLEAVNLRPVASELLISAPAPGGEPERTLAVPPLGRATVMAFPGLDRAQARALARETGRFQSFMGVAGTVAPDPSHRYRLPFREGRSYRLVQGFDGALSHRSTASRYALDFQLEVGEPVHAARAGMVVRAVDWFCRAGGRELVDQANLVIVAHDDGTMAHYVHLDHRGVLVKEGERVARGQKIGTVGMTGYTGGPHLHFVVMRERDISIPIAFEGHADADLAVGARFRVP